MAEPTPALSVIVPTREGWTRYRPIFELHRRALEGMDAELIVIDGSHEEVPPQALLGPQTRWLKHAGESVLQLRVRGYREARAAIVAQSEDHVRVPSDWAEAVLRAHAEYPDAAAIGGSTENASTANIVEWAAFFFGHGRFTPPLGVGTPGVVLGLANVSYKQWAIPGIGSVDRLGVNEVMHQRALAHSGAVLLFDDRIRCAHVQQFTFSSASRLAFHSGRAMAAIRRTHMTPTEWARAALTPIASPALTARAGLMLFRRRRYRREFVAAAPTVLWLQLCRAVGELVGYAGGPGDSPKHLH